MRHRVGAFLALIGGAAIAVATLAPIPGQAPASQATPLWCLVCGDYGGVDVLNNVLLFVPFAAGLSLRGMRLRSVVALGASLSLAIESLQLLVIPGRDASLSDLVTNTVGTWLGATLARYRMVLLQPATNRAFLLALGGVLAWTGVQTASALLLQPWAPEHSLTGIWRRQIPGRDRFDGRVTSAFLSGVAIPSGDTGLDPELGRRISQGRVHLELGLMTGENRVWWVPVFEVRSRFHSVLSLEAVGPDLAFEPPARSHRLRLRRPILRLSGALASEPGTPVQVAAGVRADTLWATWTAAGATGRAFQMLRPSLGWSLLIPIRYAYGRGVRIITGVWVALWLVPIGYWSARAGPGLSRGIWLSALALVIGLALVPGLFGYPASHWSEWVAGCVGLGLGWSAGRCGAYFGQRCDSPSTSESY